MNKEQSPDDPQMDLGWVLKKNMLNSTISVSYPDICNCMYRT